MTTVHVPLSALLHDMVSPSGLLHSDAETRSPETYPQLSLTPLIAVEADAVPVASGTDLLSRTIDELPWLGVVVTSAAWTDTLSQGRQRTHKGCENELERTM